MNVIENLVQGFINRKFLKSIRQTYKVQNFASLTKHSCEIYAQIWQKFIIWILFGVEITNYNYSYFAQAFTYCTYRNVIGYLMIHNAISYLMIPNVIGYLMIPNLIGYLMIPNVTSYLMIPNVIGCLMIGNAIG